MLRYICVYILLLLPACGLSQAFVNYNTLNSALPENSVRCIVFESDTVAWIGTDFGLVRLVNGTMTVFNTANSGLCANGIRSLSIDRGGQKWIGTFTNGLCVYNDTTWVSYNTGNSPLPDDFVRSLAIDTAGTRWIGTLAGLSRFDTLGNWTTYTMFNSVLGSNNIASIYVDKATNDKWAGTINGGVLRIEKDTNLSKFSTQNSGISDNTILDISKDQAGNMIFATPANGLVYKLNPFGWLTYNTIGSAIPSSGLTSIDLDSVDNVWIGSFDKGLIYKSGSNFSYFDSTNSPVEDESVQCVRVAPDGKIWFGTQIAGLYILDPALLSGLGELSQGTNLFAYPNPVSDLLYVAIPEGFGRFQLYDVTGRVVYETDDLHGPLQTSALQPGIYRIMVSDKAGRVRSGTIIRR